MEKKQAFSKTSNASAREMTLKYEISEGSGMKNKLLSRFC